MSTAADRLAQAHQREMATLAGGTISVVSSVALGADPMAVSTWFFGVVDSLISRIQADHAMASQSGQRFLRRHATLSGHAGVDVVPGRFNGAALRARLHITGPVAFKTAIRAGHDTDYATRSMASQMSGVAGETVLDGDRDVVHQTALHGRGVVGWRRVLIGRSCGFCAMLASRGSVYVSKESATVAKDGMAYHPHCNCAALPLYKGEREPSSVRKLQRQWERITAGHHGDDAARTWARYWDKLEPRPSRSMAFRPATQIRDALAQAQDPQAVASAFRVEFARITGRDIDAQFGGSVLTAREHAEGLLRTVERYPETPLTAVRTGPLPFARYAESERGVVTFSEHWSSVEGRPRYVAALRADERRGWHPYSSPDGVASHEVVHVLDPDVPIESIVGRRPVTGYAARSEHEAVAEAVADVMVNGERASLLSQEITAAVDDAYAAGRIVGRRPRLARPGPPARLSPPARGGPQARAAEAELQRLTVPQLKVMARERGIPGYTAMRKQELVDALGGTAPAKAAKKAVAKKAAAPKYAPPVTATEDAVRVTQRAKGTPFVHNAYGLPAEMPVPPSARPLNANEQRRLQLLTEADGSKYTRYLGYRERGYSHADAARILQMPTVAQMETKLRIRSAPLRSAGPRTPAKAAPVKKAPAKKAPAPKPLPMPEKMTGPALRKELEAAGVELPAKVARPDLQRWVVAVRSDRDTALTQIRREVAATSGLHSRTAPTLQSLIAQRGSTGLAARERAVKDAIEGAYGELRVEIGSVVVNPGREIKAAGRVLDAQGRTVGHFSRSVLVHEDGSLFARHGVLDLSREIQGSGFAEAFNANLYDWYRRSGVTQVVLTANVDVGGYAWAARGYDFAGPVVARRFLEGAEDKIAKALASFERSGKLPRGISEEDLRALGAYIEDMLHGRRPVHAPDIARFGRGSRQKGKRAVWPGKWLMLGSSWAGRLFL